MIVYRGVASLRHWAALSGPAHANAMIKAEETRIACFKATPGQDPFHKDVLTAATIAEAA
jgi:hypothetical protein